MSKLVTVRDFNEWPKLWNGEITPDILGVKLHQNEGIAFYDGDKEAFGYLRGDVIRQFKTYYHPSVITPKNAEQLIALQLLADASIPLTILSGEAGSGKTLMAIAHALERFTNSSGIRQIMIAKSMTPIGREIGFLKGEMQDKIKPWLGPFYDNFKVCGQSHKNVEDLIAQHAVEITPITFIQGRSIKNTILIIDECQNIELNVLKQIITRAGAGSEVVLLGDPTQKFENKLHQNSMQILIERAKSAPLVGHVHLNTCFRSAIASWAVSAL